MNYDNPYSELYITSFLCVVILNDYITVVRCDKEIEYDLEIKEIKEELYKSKNLYNSDLLLIHETLKSDMSIL